jgi:hypothetical protein
LNLAKAISSAAIRPRIRTLIADTSLFPNLYSLYRLARDWSSGSLAEIAAREGPLSVQFDGFRWDWSQSFAADENVSPCVAAAFIDAFAKRDRHHFERAAVGALAFEVASPFASAAGHTMSRLFRHRRSGQIDTVAPKCLHRPVWVSPPGLERQARNSDRDGNDRDEDLRGDTGLESFMASHPNIARQLRDNPSLINDQQFVRNHPNLHEYLRNHPEARY